MCGCGCNTCEIKGPLLTESKVKSLLSEGLQYHIDKKIPLFETVYRIGSDKHLSLIKEARKMYSRNIIDLCEDDEALIKTHLGEFALYEGESVPLDLPMLEEEVNNSDLDNAIYRLENVYKYLDTEYKETRRGEKFIQINYIPVTSPQSQNPEFVNVRYNNDEDIEMIKNRLGLSVLNESYDYDEVAQSEFGMDYDQLGSGEKEWVRDEIDNMSMNESTSKKHEYIVTKDDWKKSKFPFDKLKNSEFKIKISGEGEYQKYMFFWKDDGGKDFEWERGNMKRQLRSALTAIAKIKLPINTSESINESKYEKEETIQQTIDRLKARIDDPNNGLNVPFLTQKIKDLEKSLNEDKKYNQEELLRLDLIARRRFDCDYEKCTDEQKAEVLKDKVKVGVKEALQEAKQDIYDKFLDNPSSPKGRAKSLILKFTKEYGDDASSMAVDRFAKQNNLKPEEKYILKYITKNNIKISSQPGGPDFSSVSEAEFKGKEVSLNKPKRGGSKAYYVYVRDPKTKKIKKVSFGSGGLRAKIKNKEARNAFAARHKCKDKKDRTKAGYWSCNLPRYASALGLGANMNTYW